MLPFAGAFQDSLRFLDVGSPGAGAEALLGSEGGQLLCYCDVDQLVQRDTPGCGDTPGLLEQEN